MPRKRMISPEFWRDEKIAECTQLERLLFIGLWNFAEDHGVGRANPKLIKADIFPYDTLRDSDIEKALHHLAELSLIVLFEADFQKYYHVPNFKKHQTINKPTPATFPLPDDYGSATTPLPPQEKRKEEKRNNHAREKKEFTPPTLDEVKEYCHKRGNKVDPQRFHDYFSASGWVDSTGKRVLSWKQKVITWEGGAAAEPKQPPRRILT